ncbi:MAG: U32 family peptidase C-terminal domain-containing protein [Clostridia bacterium]|nr:U32 family peptidase C-terminal domain-containing protein [Clostridia bacterium]
MNKNSKRPELLSPAGNPEKLRYAVNYGADAVYCALERFGMRASAGNFKPEELKSGIEYAHSRGAKVYLTLNTMPREHELEALREMCPTLSELAPDAYIISDPGVLDIVKENVENAVIHLSTQATTVNSAAIKFWSRAGVSRVVLARELSLAEIKEIRANIPPETELECFVHGAMCVSYSGRCLLSNYYTGRNANSGACAQPCRWKYVLKEDKRGETAYTEQDEHGTYIFSSRDMRMIEHIGDLVDAGIDSFKLEGRMKSAYYTAAITNAYRIAIDDYFAGKPLDERCIVETDSVSHREYGTGYFYSSPDIDANIVIQNEYIADRPFLATVTEFNPETKLAKCYQRNKMCAGQKANLLSPGTFGKDFVIGEMFDVEMNPIDSTPHAGMEFYLKLENASSGDIIRG